MYKNRTSYIYKVPDWVNWFGMFFAALSMATSAYPSGIRILAFIVFAINSIAAIHSIGDV